LQVTPARTGRGEEAVADPCFFRRFVRQRVNPRAASGGGAWRRRAATVPAVLWLHRTGPSTVMDFLNGCFVILELFDVIFV